MTTHKNCPVDNKYFSGKALLSSSMCSHCDEAVVPNMQCIKMSIAENIQKATPMFTLNKFPYVGGPGVYMEEQGVSATDNSPMCLHLAISCVTIPLLGSN